MSGPPKLLLPGGAALLGGADLLGPLAKALRGQRAPQSLERVSLTSRALAFDVHAIRARPDTGSAVYAFAHRYGDGWWVHYVGATRDGLAQRLRGHHKLGAAIGLGATHLLVRAEPAHLVSADQTSLIDELAPPLNDRF